MRVRVHVRVYVLWSLRLCRACCMTVGPTGGRVAIGYESSCVECIQGQDGECACASAHARLRVCACVSVWLCCSCLTRHTLHTFCDVTPFLTLPLQLPPAAKAGIKPQRLSTVSDQLECCVHDEYRGTSEQYALAPPDFNTARVQQLTLAVAGTSGTWSGCCRTSAAAATLPCTCCRAASTPLQCRLLNR